MKHSIAWAFLALNGLASGCLLPEERNDDGFVPIVRRQSSTGTPVGTGDRFSGGSVAPRGLGSQSTSFSTLLNVNEVQSGLKGLVNTYGITTFTAPYTTYNGNSIVGAKIGGSGTGNDAYRVYLNGNIHARERGSMDNILYFVSDLLYANKNNVGLTYGSKTYTAAQVKTALSAGIVIVPNSNPDGTAYDQSSNSCWRKNRNPASGSVGVDLNRNFDFLWDFKTLFASSVQSSVGSTSPSSETYHGTAAFSEPETKAIKWVFDTYSKIRWFVDLHSYTGDILYSWGSDDNQVNYPYMNFKNSSYNSASDLYPTSGASDDYAYSRHFADSSKNLVHGYTIEFGFGNSAASCPFYPTVSQYNSNMKAVGAGFMELLLAAVEYGLGD
ncbi:unnamed protein product [Clonostachys rosea f. rosea IK726]|uniref:Peptidase M14 domain-containing protein n=2 Tax=Bionectria ochroleuca TaxID=29856 RepID=A0A0B7KK54_BIOOC|nr:unnamed protein product [Clonostachys rosea f. rosea IK726]